MHPACEDDDVGAGVEDLPGDFGVVVSAGGAGVAGEEGLEGADGGGDGGGVGAGAGEAVCV